MPTPAHFDDRVREAIGLGTSDRPQDLAGILHYVDSRERLVLTREELSGSLKRLIRRGAIAEVAPHRFRVARDAGTATSLTPIPRKGYDAACDEYVRSVHDAKA